MNNPSFEQLLKLAHRRAIDGKGGLAASIAKMCLDARADLTDEELRLTFDILRKLIDKVEVQIRRYIADYLADRRDVPEDLLVFLANDVVNVAYPVLVRSVQISDELMLDVIRTHGRGHQMAITKRPELSSLVVDALIDTGDNEVLIHVLRSPGAEFSAASLAKSVVRSISEEELQKPILTREGISAGVAVKMYAWVGEALRVHITENFDIDGAIVEDAVSTAIDRIQEDQAGGVEWADQGGRGHAQRLIGAAESGGEAGFQLAIAILAGVSQKEVRDAVNRDGVMSMALACRAFDMSLEQFHGLLERCRGARALDEMAGSGELAKVNAFFKTLDLSGARLVFSNWLGASSGATKH